MPGAVCPWGGRIVGSQDIPSREFQWLLSCTIQIQGHSTPPIQDCGVPLSAGVDGT